MSKSAQAILLPIFASFAIVLLIVPFVWHWKLRNLGACSLIFWLTIANTFIFINAIIWPDENYDSWWDGRGLCDIEVKLKWPQVTGIACATLCITRNLANVLDVDNQGFCPSSATRRRGMAMDLAICFTIPVLQISLHYIIQPNRYMITAVGGCADSYDNSWPTIVIMFMWPLIFCLITFYYAVYVIVRIRKYRAQFASILSSSSSNLTTTRFLRLFVLSLTILLIYTPVSIYFFYVSLNITWLSYDWGVIHNPDVWWSIPYRPALGVRTFDCWVAITMSYFMFAYFGLGNEAVSMYRKWMLSIGLGRIFPVLRGGRRHRAPGEEKSWGSQFSLISRARSYLDNSRKNSTADTIDSIIDRASEKRKHSVVECIDGAGVLLPNYTFNNDQCTPFSEYASPTSSRLSQSKLTSGHTAVSPSLTNDKYIDLPKAVLPPANTQRHASCTKLTSRKGTSVHGLFSTLHVTPPKGEPTCKSPTQKQTTTELECSNPLKADLTTRVWSTTSLNNNNGSDSRQPVTGTPIAADTADDEADITPDDWKNCVRVGTKIDRRESYHAPKSSALVDHNAQEE